MCWKASNRNRKMTFLSSPRSDLPGRQKGSQTRKPGDPGWGNAPLSLEATTQHTAFDAGCRWSYWLPVFLYKKKRGGGTLPQKGTRRQRHANQKKKKKASAEHTHTIQSHVFGSLCLGHDRTGRGLEEEGKKSELTIRRLEDTQACRGYYTTAGSKQTNEQCPARVAPIVLR